MLITALAGAAMPVLILAVVGMLGVESSTWSARFQIAVMAGLSSGVTGAIALLTVDFVLKAMRQDAPWLYAMGTAGPMCGLVVLLFWGTQAGPVWIAILYGIPFLIGGSVLGLARRAEGRFA
ncbi:MAG: hypothetical protein ACK4I0_08575 [Brevundimonas sp.]|uniref:hypothetical protein n=1 Tax=Brevundimonas sp. TaxID=1871086 RepID=UPI00391CF71C